MWHYFHVWKKNFCVHYYMVSEFYQVFVNLINYSFILVVMYISWYLPFFLWREKEKVNPGGMAGITVSVKVTLIATFHMLVTVGGGEPLTGLRTAQGVSLTHNDAPCSRPASRTSRHPSPAHVLSLYVPTHMCII